jgi:hypothetical protein
VKSKDGKAAPALKTIELPELLQLLEISELFSIPLQPNFSFE